MTMWMLIPLYESDYYEYVAVALTPATLAHYEYLYQHAVAMGKDTDFVHLRYYDFSTLLCDTLPNCYEAWEPALRQEPEAPQVVPAPEGVQGPKALVDVTPEGFRWTDGEQGTTPLVTLSALSQLLKGGC